MTTTPLYSAASIRESERQTMLGEPISSLDLMERAGSKAAQLLLQTEHLDRYREIVIFCGPGNNGGDGLVIARILAQQNLTVKVILCLAPESNTTPEFNANLKRWESLSFKQEKASTHIFEADAPPEIQSGTLILDALFGIGLSRPLSGYYAAVVHNVNNARQRTISIDVPSGLFIDKTTPSEYAVIRAAKTYTFQFYKVAFLLPEVYERCGNVQTIDIGLKAIVAADEKKYLITKELIKPFRPKVMKYAHKGNNGHGLLIAGSSDMPGAAIMAATAAMRGGIGKITVHTAAKVTAILPVALPEALLHADQNECYITSVDMDAFPTVNAVAVGPGIGQHKSTLNMLKDLLDNLHSPIILDADALNLLAENKTWIDSIPRHSILTPHFKEFERLTGKVHDDFERIEKLTAFAQRHELVVILKGAHTAVAMPDGKLFFNTTGNPGMATAGSGDVLTGLLLALLSKGLTPPIAALYGVYLHGLAGDLAICSDHSYESLIASDLPLFFGAAFNELYKC